MEPNNMVAVKNCSTEATTTYVDMVPMIDCNPTRIPIGLHSFWLDVEIRIQRFGYQIQSNMFSSLQFGLDFFRQRKGLVKLSPRPVAIPFLSACQDKKMVMISLF